jgi:adenylate kinase family enzyme
MKPITAIFFGRSGSGKGTQAALLIEHLKKQDAANSVIYIETGARLREFIKRGGYTAGLVDDTVMKKGGLMPAFFPIWLWSGMMIDELKTGNEHMIFDGVCRRVIEPPVLDTALKFFGREKPAIIFLEVHHDSAKERLLKRGRHDDQEHKIVERMRWFDADVVPAVKFYMDNPEYRYLHINGDQSIEDVRKDIFKALGI